MQTITEVSRMLNVSTRMLRYYEQQGLIRSHRRPDYAYRIYDEENISRLRIILVLRKLRVSLKDIRMMLSDCNAEEAISLLQARVQEVEDEMRSLAAVRDALMMLVKRIAGAADTAQRIVLLGDEGLLEAVQALGLSNKILKERNIVSEINHAEQEQWKRLNVRLIQLPPMTVASFRYEGPEPEDHAQAMLADFIREGRLYDVKPDSRVFGFNSPNPLPDREYYGYEYWVTIPPDMDVPAPGVRKSMPGGLYAAHGMEFPNFHEWQWLSDWVENSAEWQGCPGEPENMFGLLEEHLNWVYAIAHDRMKDGTTRKLDLLMPVRKREQK